MPSSVAQLLERALKNCPDDVAAMVKTRGSYQDVSWRRIGTAVQRLADALMVLGVTQGDRVGIALGTGLGWVVVDLAVMTVGAVTVPLHPGGPHARTRHVLSTTGAKLVFLGDAENVAGLSSERGELPALQHVVSVGDGPIGDWDRAPHLLPKDGELGTPGPTTEDSLPWHLDWSTFIECARTIDQVKLTRPELNADSILTILFTEGTTDKPKGVVLTHGALLYQADAVTRADLVRTTDKQLLFLPLTHAFARLLVVSWLHTRHVMAFAERPELATLARNLREVRPTIIAVVPRVVEGWAALVIKQGHRRFGPVFDRARYLAAKEARNSTHVLSIFERAQLAPLRPLMRIVGETLLNQLGGRLRLCVCGGAPLAAEAQHLMDAIGLKVLQGYGLTETGGAISIDRPHRHKSGSVGSALDGTEVRIGNDGEVLARGPGMMRGYWRDPAATAEAFTKDGWLHTGDLGRLEGTRLWLTGRSSATIVTSAGERIAPAVIEKELCKAKLIAHAMVCGDKEPYPVALIVVDRTSLEALAQKYGFSGGTYAVSSQRPEVRLEVAKVVSKVNAGLQSHLILRNFALMRRHFSDQSGELTVSGVLRRSEILKRHADEIRRLYAQPAPDLDTIGRTVRRPWPA